MMREAEYSEAAVEEESLFRKFFNKILIFFGIKRKGA